MPNKSFQLQSYRVIAGRGLQLRGTSCKALINCYGPDGFRMDIYFKAPDGVDVPNTASIDNKRGTMFLPGEDFDSYLRFLQTESPINASMSEENPINNQLYTGSEPVGEEET